MVRGTFFERAFTDLLSSGERTERDVTESGVPARSDTAYLESKDLVVQLLSQHEGRMWQGEIATEMDWSASKASRVLSDLETAGVIERCRIGREKAIFLPEQRPDDLTVSPR